MAELFDDVKIGIGTWAWGDRLFWGYGKSHSAVDVDEAFQASIDNGITFFDTAEAYGFGASEKLLGEAVRQHDHPVKIATKFMPYPWRLRQSSLQRALQKSLQRLQMEQVDLYQIHWPFPPRSIQTWMAALAEAVAAGRARAVGVSNYNVDQTERALNALQRHDVPLASNQVEYSLLNRKIEHNGLLALCQQHNITIIAYSPLAQGLLTGKYTSDNPPPGIRGLRYRRKLQQIEPLIALLHEIGSGHGDKTPAQVALNWIIRKGAVPIPGAKNARQAEQNAGAVGWELSPDEVAALDSASEGAS